MNMGGGIRRTCGNCYATKEYDSVNQHCKKCGWNPGEEENKKLSEFKTTEQKLENMNEKELLEEAKKAGGMSELLRKAAPFRKVEIEDDKETEEQDSVTEGLRNMAVIKEAMASTALDKGERKTFDIEDLKKEQAKENSAKKQYYHDNNKVINTAIKPLSDEEIVEQVLKEWLQEATKRLKNPSDFKIDERWIAEKAVSLARKQTEEKYMGSIIEVREAERKFWIKEMNALETKLKQKIENLEKQLKESDDDIEELKSHLHESERELKQARQETVKEIFGEFERLCRQNQDEYGDLTCGWTDIFEDLKEKYSGVEK